jgi:hypothetical protein
MATGNIRAEELHEYALTAPHRQDLLRCEIAEIK